MGGQQLVHSPKLRSTTQEGGIIERGAMSLELVAILVTSLLELGGLVVLGTMLYRMWGKREADDASIHLQGRRIEEVLREMRGELVRR